jgi:TPR repeat protein
MRQTGGLPRRALLLAALAAPYGLVPRPTAAQSQSSNDIQEGLRAYSQGNYTGALRLWAPLAQRGDTVAQYNIGRLYARGEGVARDLPEAYKWFILSAAGGRREGEQARQAIMRAMTPVQQAEGVRRADAWRRQQSR